MPRFLSLLVAVLGAGTILTAVLGYLPLRDFALNGTPGFSPKSHFVLGPLSLGLESALENSTPGIIDAAAYCVALQNRLFLLAAIGLTVLFISIATARSTADRK
jgi:hypothetical protein